MKANRMLGFACLAVMLPALVAAQSSTTYDFDRTASFAKYHTYAIKEGATTGDPLIDARIVAALGSQLSLKGLSKASASPDVYVLFHMDYDKQKEYSTYSPGPLYGGYGWGWGWGWGWGSGISEVRVRDILVGTLTIDIVDAKSNQIAWRGVRTKEVDTDDDPEDRDKAVAKAVAKIMRHYPPGFDDE